MTPKLSIKTESHTCGKKNLSIINKANIATITPYKSMGKLKCSGTVNTSCSTCGPQEVAVYFLLKENKTKYEGKFTLHE